MMNEAEKIIIKKNNAYRLKSIKDLKTLFNSKADFIDKQEILNSKIEGTMKFFRQNTIDNEMAKATKLIKKSIIKNERLMKTR